VRRFIADEIVSVEQLEVLLVLRGSAEVTWTAADVARTLVIRSESASAWLEDLARRGLLRREDGRYRYDPPDLETEHTLDQLAGSYAKYRVAVVRLIFSTPSERVTVFAEGLRLRRP
jgi:hypothetical protein